MARVELEATWTTTKPLGDARSAVQGFFARHGVKAGARADGVLSGKQGSQLITRLLGGWFVGPAKLPKTISVALTAEASVVKVHVRLAEDLGFGYLDPHFKDRYEKFFAAWMEELRAALP